MGKAWGGCKQKINQSANVYGTWIKQFWESKFESKNNGIFCIISLSLSVIENKWNVLNRKNMILLVLLSWHFVDAISILSRKADTGQPRSNLRKVTRLRIFASKIPDNISIHLHYILCRHSSKWTNVRGYITHKHRQTASLNEKIIRFLHSIFTCSNICHLHSCRVGVRDTRSFTPHKRNT